jgi:hypothetical protein
MDRDIWIPGEIENDRSTHRLQLKGEIFHGIIEETAPEGNIDIESNP